MKLGLRALARGHLTRETLIRIAAPVEDARFVELPSLLAAIPVQGGERILDLASPKLAAIEFARRGAQVVSVDQFEPEVEEWRGLARGVDGVTFEVGDGRKLPFADGEFDHAYSISVIEHIGDDGDLDALGELARVTKPGGRVVVSFPYGETPDEEWRDAPVYSEDGTEQSGRWFYQRRYDPARVERLLAAAPSLRELSRRPVRFAPSGFYRFYGDHAPWTLPLGPVLAWVVDTEDAPGGFLFLVLERSG